ncbi:MAG: HD domain-containing protein [Thermodesulfobacteriota bacterium]|jgi:metal-dependent HD superfamily phosphatase/phosphodiesterase
MHDKESIDKEARSGQAPETGSSDALKLQERFLIRVPARHNPRLQKIIDRVNADDELYTLWQVVNLNAVKRLGTSDHGPVHVQIVTNIALKLVRLLSDRGVQPNSVLDYNLTTEDAEVIVVLAALLHDVGMSIHRAGHELYSLFLAGPKIKELLDGIYDVPMRTILNSEILQAIISHRADSHPMTLEAGIVRVADALDMEEGRTRIPFQEGKINIHSVSAASIERISIEPGEVKPIRIVVGMSNSAGIFQLDELFKNKLEGSGLEAYVEVDASIKGEAEKKLIHTFRI